METNTTQTAAPKTMSAKFAGRCACDCGASIAVGQRITWSRETGARIPHGAATIARQSSPVRTQSVSTGRRTGCSCGSREDAWGDLIPSRRNCAGCTHDAE